jgi:superfamily II DNA helicase RecQ
MSNDLGTLNDDQIRDIIARCFDKRPCLLQLKLTRHVLAQQDLIGVAATGTRKTLSFFMALALHMDMNPQFNGIVIVATPLVTLGKQTEKMLQDASIPAVAIDGQSSSAEVFKVG